MYRFTVFETKSNDWNWKLVYQGKNMAGGHEGPGGFASMESAIENLKDTARVFVCAYGDLSVMSSVLRPGDVRDLGTTASGIRIELTVEKRA